MAQDSVSFNVLDSYDVRWTRRRVRGDSATHTVAFKEGNDIYAAKAQGSQSQSLRSRLDATSLTWSKYLKPLS